MRGRAATARVGLVDHIVVDQRGAVDVLDDRRQENIVRTVGIHRACAREQVKHRADALPAGFRNKFADLRGRSRPGELAGAL